MSEVTQVSANKSYGGWQKVYTHESEVCKCTMKFGVYLPPQAEDAAEGTQFPVLYWLSGLTCTEQNFIGKAGAQKFAAEHGFIIVNPDTSPRGCNIEGEDDAYDFGSGAGFYVDATEEKWKAQYNMYSYVTKELPKVISANFKVDSSKQGIFGHSMGGHGAIVCALKNPGMYKSVSAFAPICNPMQCPWGQKAFKGYLGEDQEQWKAYDSCELVKSYNGPPLEILIHQGKEDGFLKESQLLPDAMVAACTSNKMPVVLHMEEGYDHSYYFIATFMEHHFKHHAKFLKE